MSFPSTPPQSLPLHCSQQRASTAKHGQSSLVFAFLPPIIGPQTLSVFHLPSPSNPSGAIWHLSPKWLKAVARSASNLPIARHWMQTPVCIGGRKTSRGLFCSRVNSDAPLCIRTSTPSGLWASPSINSHLEFSQGQYEIASGALHWQTVPAPLSTSALSILISQDSVGGSTL